MRLIDADKLYPDSVSIKGDRLCISQSQIANAPTVDVLDKIRDEIEQLHYHPKLDFIKNDEVVEMALDVIDKYR